ncbi:hypothetical protein CC85DRAFT_26670 [Cutaneotrichosporon oleaginosum]|uniref:RING-type E3 ubiquitin transferase n=1 Tax=Cutaneotrichosporon oleaginosum TaxID=879819 RepID=A0A0J0XBX3_9TREE|nr:uncharacterized protein CC85DRAFT_26670 [Cutaneotrichosporon oleaginosum]KLT38560.1 hypothetical protein CC85DRAFT_26670 [Cutaneotrichosporon oleaginosum]TXT08482.1 hypothetical protein COLE_05406 [Cutaneotrichosporon oleaginosum]
MARTRPRAAASNHEPERCCICLLPMRDPARAGCAHTFCFTCLGVWAEHSRRCPLCNADMGEYIEHDLDERQPTKFFLQPLEEGFTRRVIRPPSPPAPSAGPSSGPSLTIVRRREIYASQQWARHVGANEWTGYRVALTPHDLQSGAERARALTFLERELRVWAPPHDVPHLARRLVKMFSAVDLRSPAAVHLLEPLVGDTYPHAAEHLVHELTAFLRSPFSLEEWDDVVQYGKEEYEEATRGRSRSRSRSVSVDRSGRSISRGRIYSPAPSRSSSRSPSRGRSRSGSRPSSPGRGRGYDSFRPRLRSRSRSRSRSPSSPRSSRRWDQGDSWVDPEFRKSKPQRKAVPERERHVKQVHDSGPSLLSRVAPPQAFQRAVAGAGIEIRGAADRRHSLRERLVRAKAEAKAEAENSGAPAPPNTTEEPTSEQPVEENGHAVGGDRAAELREKLLADRKKRQLREQLLARKRARSAVAAAAEDVKARALNTTPIKGVASVSSEKRAGAQMDGGGTPSKDDNAKVGGPVPGASPESAVNDRQ